MDHIGTDRLRRGRISIPNARYFITMVTKDRCDGLIWKAIADAFVLVLREMQIDGDIELYCATLMPDHCHLLYRLGTRLKLDRVQSKLKSRTSEALREQGLEWQSNFFDHRLRENIAVEEFVRYIYLNPYAKSLLPLESKWPHWILNKNYQPEFFQHLEGGVAPPEEWLAKSRKLTELIEADMA